MRPDMSKVVTEMPRSGSGYNNNARNTVTATRAKVRDYDCDDDLWAPERSGGSRSFPKLPYDSKGFTDVLGPLRGYLRKQVGRPWDKVYSEMSKYLDRRSLQGRHIWTHVWQEVDVHCYLGDDGKVYSRPRRYYSRFDSPLRPDGLYVHPVTGILRWDKPPRQRVLPNSRYALGRKLRLYGIEIEKPVIDDWRIVDALTVLERRAGVWLVRRYIALDPEEVLYTKTIGDRDVPVRRKDTKDAATKRLVSTRQLGRREKALWAIISKEAV